MKPKNTLKFIIVLVVVGFFGSILLSGSGSKNQAQLSSPIPLLAAAVVAIGDNVIGKTPASPVAVEGSDFQVKFQAPVGAEWLNYSVCPVNATGVVSALNCRTYDNQQEVFMISNINEYAPGVYSVTAEACVEGYCSTASEPIYIKVRERVTEKIEEVPQYTFWTINAKNEVYRWDRGTNWTQIRPPAEEVVSSDVSVTSPEVQSTGFVGELVGDVRNFFLRAQDFVAGVFKNIADWFDDGSSGPTGGQKEPIVTLGVDNIEVVKIGPGAANMVVTVAPATPGINCGQSCLRQQTEYPAGTPLVVTVSNVDPNYGSFSYNFYQSDGFNNQPQQTHPSSTFSSNSSFFPVPPNCPANSPTCTFVMPQTSFIPSGAMELWIEPTACGQAGDLVNVGPQYTATSQSSTSVNVSKTVSATVPSGITYDLQLTWGPTLTNNDQNLIGNVQTISSTNSSVTLSGLITGLTPNTNYYLGLNMTKNMPSGGSSFPDYCFKDFDNPFKPSGEAPTGASLTIEKVTLDSAGTQIQTSQAFNFTGSGAQTIAPFSLNTATQPSKPFNPITPGSYVITEAIPAGWQNVSVYCTGVNVNQNILPPSAGFSLSLNGTGHCKFTNKMIGETPTLTTCKQDQASGKLSIVGPTVQNISSTVKNLLGMVTVTGSIPANVRYLSQIGYTSNAAPNPSYPISTKYIPSGFPTTGTQIVDWAGNSAQVTPPAGSYRPYIYICKQQNSGGIIGAAAATPSTSWSNIGPCCNQDGEERDWFSVQPETPTTGTIIINKVIQQGDVGGLWTKQYIEPKYDFSFSGALNPGNFTLDADASSNAFSDTQQFNNVQVGNHNFLEISALNNGNPTVSSPWVWGSKVNCVKTSGTGNSTGTVESSFSKGFPHAFNVNLAANDTVTCTVTNSVVAL